MAHLATIDGVIDALGGTVEVRELTDAESPQAIHNWRSRGLFPARLHHLMTKQLEDRGHTADPKLWGQVLEVSEPPAPALASGP